MVGAMGHMLQLQAQELLLHFAYLREICFHVLVHWLVHLVGEVDEELRVSLDGEALHPQGHRRFEAGDETIILCDVVGDLFAPLEAELHYIVKLVLSGRDEHGSSPRALACERVKVHDPAIWRFTPW